MNKHLQCVGYLTYIPTHLTCHRTTATAWRSHALTNRPPSMALRGQRSRRPRASSLSRRSRPSPSSSAWSPVLAASCLAMSGKQASSPPASLGPTASCLGYLTTSPAVRSRDSLIWKTTPAALENTTPPPIPMTSALPARAPSLASSLPGASSAP